jgi:hypothetical protein
MYYTGVLKNTKVFFKFADNNIKQLAGRYYVKNNIEQ